VSWRRSSPKRSVASRRLHDVEPWSYLRDVFCVLPTWSKRGFLDPAPLAWKEPRERDDVGAVLEANLFRKLTLAPTS